jgi:hypothetical protein
VSEAARVIVLDVGARRDVNLAWESDGSTRLVIGIQRVPPGSHTIPKEISVMGVPVLITDM